MSTHVWPNLGYSDAPAALRFLVDVLGFEAAAVYEGARKDTIAHAQLRWPQGGGVTIHTTESSGHSARRLAEQAARAGDYPAFSIHVDTDEPDAVYARARAAGATVVQELSDSPHGTRGFVVQDPGGFYWSIGTPLPSQVRDGDAWTARSDADGPRPSG